MFRRKENIEIREKENKSKKKKMKQIESTQTGIEFYALKYIKHIRISYFLFFFLKDNDDYA